VHDREAVAMADERLQRIRAVAEASRQASLALGDERFERPIIDREAPADVHLDSDRRRAGLGARQRQADSTTSRLAFGHSRPQQALQPTVSVEPRPIGAPGPVARRGFDRTLGPVSRIQRAH
jgi:hypothetical protein